MSLAGVRLFAHIGFPNTGRRGLLVVFKAYLDRSVQGEHGHRIAVIAGAVSPEYRWTKFESEWNAKVLKPYGICAYSRSDCEAGRKEFVGWSRNRRNEITKIAIAVTRKWYDFGICAALDVEDFEELTQGSSRRHPYTKSPYALCFFSAIAFVIFQLRNRRVPASTKTALYFDREEKVSNLIQNYWNSYLHSRDTEERIISATPGTVCQFMPLQAADILAWETGKRFLEWRHDPQRAIRSTLRAVGSESQLSIQYFHANNLRPIIEAMKSDGVF